MNLICNLGTKLNIYSKLKYQLMRRIHSQESHLGSLLDQSRDDESRIDLGRGIVLTAREENGIVFALRVSSGKVEQQIDLLADYPQTEVVIDKSKDYYDSVFVNKEGRKRVIVGDLAKDGMRLVLLHELEHSARAEIADKKDKARSKFYEIVTEGKDVDDWQDTGKSDDEQEVKVAVWLPAVVDGKLSVKKFYRKVPKKVLLDYIDSWVESEKESWQAALAKYRQLKEKGIDLEPNLSEEQIENIAKESLVYYQRLLDSMEINDQIALPQFWEREKGEGVDLERLRGEILSLLNDDRVSYSADILDKLADLKQQALESYAEEALDIEVQFGVVELLLKQKMLREKKKADKELFRDLAEYQYLLTFYVDHSRDREELGKLWDYFYQVDALLNKDKKTAAALQYGIVGQVAVNKIFRKLDIAYHLATPAQDAYQKTDAWVDISQQTALQIKRYKDFDQPVLLPVEQISFPALVRELPTSNVKRIYSVADELRAYALKKEQLAQSEGRKIEAFMVILPGKGIDNITGEPKDEVVDFFRQHLSELKSNNKAA